MESPLVKGHGEWKVLRSQPQPHAGWQHSCGPTLPTTHLQSWFVCANSWGSCPENKMENEGYRRLHEIACGFSPAGVRKWGALKELFAESLQREALSSGASITPAGKWQAGKSLDLGCGTANSRGQIAAAVLMACFSGNCDFLCLEHMIQALSEWFFKLHWRPNLSLYNTLILGYSENLDAKLALNPPPVRPFQSAQPLKRNTWRLAFNPTTTGEQGPWKHWWQCPH